MTAVLTFLDFFPSSLQLTAIETAVCISRKMPRELGFDIVLGIVPNLAPILTRQDEKLLPIVVTFFSNIVDSNQHEYGCFLIDFFS